MKNVTEINNNKLNNAVNSMRHMGATSQIKKIQVLGTHTMHNAPLRKKDPKTDSLFALASKPQEYPLIQRASLLAHDAERISMVSTVTSRSAPENPMKDFMTSLGKTEKIEAKEELSDEEIDKLSKEEILELLILKNYNPLTLSNSGDSMIHLATKKNDLLAIKLGHRYGLDLQMPNKTGITPLHVAAEKGNLEIVKFLIGKGVPINWTNELNQTPFHKALKNNHTEIVDFLKASGYQPGDATTDYLIASGYDPSVVDNGGNTIFHKAALSNDTEILELLIAKGWTIDSLNKNHITPLMLAISKGHIEAIELLIKHNANINCKDIEGNTPIITAIKYKQHFILNTLLENPAILLNALNNQGIAALHYSVALGDIYAVQALINKGAFIDILTNPNYRKINVYQGTRVAPVVTPLAIAESLHPTNSAMKQLLMDHEATYFYEKPFFSALSQTLEAYLKL